MKNKITAIGGIGTVLTAICCFTPILVVIFTSIGVAGAIVYLDYVLLPLLIFFIGLTGYGFYTSKNE